ncbi:hypothetical protein BSL84_33635 [Streptomyces sp. TN58]|nr:hypothetical protein BSL84_00865 [Streptomyces sp. TN58]APU43925.1 hypothetical protein BSL84_33635 [Streptomyces sp. TN58]
MLPPCLLRFFFLWLSSCFLWSCFFLWSCWLWLTTLSTDVVGAAMAEDVGMRTPPAIAAAATAVARRKPRRLGRGVSDVSNFRFMVFS